jgi:SlyX protein
VEGQMQDIEEQIAHLQHIVDDLSAVVADQQTRLMRAEARIGLLLQREAEREVEGGGTIPLADQTPPHY